MWLPGMYAFSVLSLFYPRLPILTGLCYLPRTVSPDGNLPEREAEGGRKSPLWNFPLFPFQAPLTSLPLFPALPNPPVSPVQNSRSPVLPFPLLPLQTAVLLLLLLIFPFQASVLLFLPPLPFLLSPPARLPLKRNRKGSPG